MYDNMLFHLFSYFIQTYNGGWTSGVYTFHFVLFNQTEQKLENSLAEIHAAVMSIHREIVKNVVCFASLIEIKE